MRKKYFEVKNVKDLKDINPGKNINLHYFYSMDKNFSFESQKGEFGGIFEKEDRKYLLLGNKLEDRLPNSIDFYQIHVFSLFGEEIEKTFHSVSGIFIKDKKNFYSNIWKEFFEKDY
jgi:hypothetical protein